jgi:quercetin dioxygenase-like cupin family protein
LVADFLIEDNMNTLKKQAQELAGRFDTDLGIVHHFSSGVYAKQMALPAGYTALSHSHKFDHMSILAKGEVLVKTDDSDVQKYIAPTVVTIKAGVNHAIHALTDVSWFCVHATEETDEEHIDEVLIEKVEV